MNEALANAVDAVSRERGSEFKDAFDAAKLVIAEHKGGSLAERILSDVPASIPWEVVADLLRILEWSSKDNGASIHRQAEQWLSEARDLRRIQVALHLDVFPFRESNQMEQVLTRVAAAIPEVAARCEAVVVQRRAQQTAARDRVKKRGA